MKVTLDPNKTKAILIGTTKFIDFPDIKPVENNLNEFAKVLADKNIFGLLPEKNIKVIKDAGDDEVELKLDEFSKTAKKEGVETLIVYFAGHGFRNREGKYFLATKNSKKNSIRRNGKTAIAYDTVKVIIKESQIPQIIVLIDACYSGSVAQGEGEQVFEEYRAKGTYTLTSSNSTELSYFDTDATHTIFTGELLNIFKNGLPNIEQEKVSLSDLYTELRTAVKKKKPEMSPQQLASNEITGDNFLFFKNIKYDKEAVKRKKIEILIEKGEVFFKRLNFEQAEYFYLKAERVAKPPEKFNHLIDQIDVKMKKCEEIKEYKSVFEKFFKEQIHQDQNIIIQLKQEIAGLQESLKRKQSEIDKLQATVKQDKAIKDKLLQEKTTLEKSLQNKQQELEQEKSNIFNLEKKLAEKEKQITEQRKIISDLTKVSQIAIVKNIKETVNNTSFEMVFVKGGKFTMGSNDGDNDEKLIHEVTVPDFYIGKHPVTQKLWRKVMGQDPDELYFKGNDNNPVERVSWYDVQEFIIVLNKKTGKNNRLPTEAEWEFAARGGIKSKGYKYAGSNNIDDVAWYDKNSNNKTHLVGQKKANELGIYDMSGNVWEWVQDKWHNNYNDAPNDGSAWETGESLRRVLRGSGWGSGAGYCRVASRGYDGPGSSGSGLGFRLVFVP